MVYRIFRLFLVLFFVKLPLLVTFMCRFIIYNITIYLSDNQEYNYKSDV